jgi:hypothetical protein
MATASMKLKSRLARFEQELCRFTVEKVFKGFPPSMAQVKRRQKGYREEKGARKKGFWKF